MSTFLLTDYSAILRPSNGGSSGVGNASGVQFVDMTDQAGTVSGSSTSTVDYGFAGSNTAFYYVGRFVDWQSSTIAAGTWQVGWSIVGSPIGSFTLNSIYIDRVDSSGNPLENIGALTGIGSAIASGSSFSQNVSGSQVSLNRNETVIVSFQITCNFGAGPQFVIGHNQAVIAPAQTIYTPSLLVARRRKKNIVLPHSEINPRRRRLPYFIVPRGFNASDSGTGTDTGAYSLSGTDGSAGNAIDSGAQSYYVFDQSLATYDYFTTLLNYQSDSGTGTDSGSVFQSPNYVITDTATGTETPSLSVTVSTTDSAVGDDSQTALTLAQMSVSDGSSGSAVDSGYQAIPVLDANTSVTETTTIDPSSNFVDYAQAVDSGYVQQTDSVSDSATGVDSGSLSASFQPSADQNSSVVETPSLSMTASIIDSTATGSDFFTTLLNNQSDSGTGTDTPSVSIQLSVSETGRGSEPSYGYNIVANLSLTDSTSPATDSSSAFTVAQSCTDNTGSGIDYFTTLLNYQNDSGTGTDTGAVSIAMSGSDSGKGSEPFPSLAASFSFSETLPAVSETLSYTASYSLNETALGTDNNSGSTTTVSFMFLDALLSHPHFPIFNGIDSGSVSIAHSLLDAGQGEDSANLAGINFPIAAEIYGGGQTP